MKKIKRIIAMICALLTMATISSCTFHFGVMDPDSGSFSGQEGSSVIDVTPPESNSQNSSSSNVNEDMGGGKEDNEKDEGYKNDPDYMRYSYAPIITETMPRIQINTNDKDSSFATKYGMQDKIEGKIDYVDCSVTVDKCEEKYEIVQAAAEVKVRGNATLNYIKKPLRLKFKKKTTMLGLNNDAKCKSWVLLADWKDLSMLNNDLAFYFGKTILGSDGYYSSDFRRVNVYINGAYWGVYLLVEQQQVNQYRVDIEEPEDDYTGNDIGYLMEYDGYYTNENRELGGDYTFEMSYYHNAGLKTLNGGMVQPRVNGYTIKSDVYAQSQVDFIRSYMDNVYTIAYKAVYEHQYYTFNSDFTGIVKASYKNAEETVSAVIDVQSLVDSYMLQEIACDYDVDWSSVYMDVDLSKNGKKKLTFEAPWDWDSSFGVRPDVNSAGMYAANRSNPWFILFINESWFQEMIRDKWQDLQKFHVLDGALNMITECKEAYKENYEANYRRWSTCLDALQGERTDALNACKSQAEAADILYNWLYTRLNFLNSQWGDGSDILIGK